MNLSPTTVRGASGSGTVSVGGMLNVVITQVITKAMTGNNVHLTGKNVNVIATDDYDLIAVVVTAAVSGVVGVGVSALVSVAFNTVTAKIGENNIITATKNINVSAASDRRVITFVATAGGGQVGVAGSIAVIVVGSMLNDDAHDGIYTSNTDGDTTYSAMDPQSQTDGAFSSANSKAVGGYKPNQSMDEMLAGDGENVDGLGVDGNEYGQDESGEGDMNDDLYDDTAEKSLGEPQGATVNGMELSDTTSAIVGAGSHLTAQGGNILVKSKDNTNIDAITGTLAIGLWCGVGVGLAVAIVSADVQAVVESGAVLSASGDVTVLAMAGAADDDIPVLNDDAQEVNDKIKADILDSDISAVRMISITGGGGFVGVSVAIAALIVQTSTRAILAGDVTSADNVYVYTQANYGQILAVTLNASGGVVAVNGSITVVYFGGTVEAGIAGTANIKNVGTVEVVSSGITRALSAALAMSGGLVAVNAALALAINITRIDTYIGQGVVIDATSADIKVKSDFTVEADVLILSVAIGGAGVGVTVAIAINSPTCLTYIGKTPYGDPLATSEGANGYIKAHNIDVTNDIDGNVTVVGPGHRIRRRRRLQRHRSARIQPGHRLCRDQSSEYPQCQHGQRNGTDGR